MSAETRARARASRRRVKEIFFSIMSMAIVLAMGVNWESLIL